MAENLEPKKESNIVITRLVTSIDMKEFLHKIKFDPVQSRLSLFPITVFNPRTRKGYYLTEYAEEISEDGRLAIETQDGYFIFISKIIVPDGENPNSSTDLTPRFFATQVLSRHQLNEMRKTNKK